MLLGFSFTLVFVLFFCSGVQPAREILLITPPLCDFFVTPPVWTQLFPFVIFSVFLHGEMKTVFVKQTSRSDLYQLFGVSQKSHHVTKVFNL